MSNAFPGGGSVFLTGYFKNCYNKLVPESANRTVLKNACAYGLIFSIIIKSGLVGSN